MNFPILRSEGTREISQPQSGWCLAQKNLQVPQGRRNSIVLSERNFGETQSQPLCGWLISGRRSATQFVLAALVLFFAVGATAETTNDLSDAKIQGRNLAQQLLEQQPTENFTNAGVAKIRSSQGLRYDIPVRFQTVVTATNWQVIYETTSESYRVKFVVFHSEKHTNRYQFRGHELAGDEMTTPFVGDFWIADLGLEFFQWPGQTILKHEMRRGQPCKVLESVNPNPPTNGYSRVVSWIDNESGGIVHAEAYDANGELLKEFDPKSFKKVNGQWELQDMEIRNAQTGSRTRLEFDLKSH